MSLIGQCFVCRKDADPRWFVHSKAGTHRACDGCGCSVSYPCDFCKVKRREMATTGDHPTTSSLLIALVQARREQKEHRYSDSTEGDLKLKQAEEAYSRGIQRELDKLSPEEQALACTCGHLKEDHVHLHECSVGYYKNLNDCPVEHPCTPYGGMCEAPGCPCLAGGYK